MPGETYTSSEFELDFKIFHAYFCQKKISQRVPIPTFFQQHSVSNKSANLRPGCHVLSQQWLDLVPWTYIYSQNFNKRQFKLTCTTRCCQITDEGWAHGWHTLLHRWHFCLGQNEVSLYNCQTVYLAEYMFRQKCKAMDTDPFTKFMEIVKDTDWTISEVKE